MNGHLTICSLLIDTVSRLDHIPSNGMSDEFEGVRKEAVLAYSRGIFRNLPGGTEINREIAQ